MIEIAANLATVVVAVIVAILLINNYSSGILRRESLQGQATSLRTINPDITGTNLSKQFSDIEWKKNGSTVVLALSTHCHFCTESAPFFRRIRSVVGNKVKLVGLLPEPLSEARSYLTREGLHLDEVRQIPLSSIGVAGTPTMLLVNNAGVVTRAWVGKLKAEEETLAMKEIRMANLLTSRGAL